MPDEIDAYFERTEWQEEAAALRRIVLATGLTEEVKWHQPCYTWGGHNIVLLHRLKAAIGLAFMRGSLLKDPAGILEAPGENSRHGRRAMFTSVAGITAAEATLTAYIHEAVGLAEAGVRVEKPAGFDLPDELAAALEADAALQAAFEALTPGRRRYYAIYFGEPKKAETRVARIAKYRDKILSGRGVNDR
ncbi:YdeI family protein [Acuticoccus sp. I52.16.1]|uniref:YdeI/OmpD-associated family protein n=1 Tax=Acuticoccus sp. I52.16.1 TaxID=2928472 RepID=UPI001FD0AA61|nr:YdeI/OmpD-associated family protein [Acuticoccus sp. I52.16.1]UOM35501.1 YdeI/OmpD-associated family protein [Acuticoccus sp. I52.16.1]